VCRKALVESSERRQVIVKAMVDGIGKLAVREAVESREGPADVVNLAVSAGSIDLLRSHCGGCKLWLMLLMVRGMKLPGDDERATLEFGFTCMPPASPRNVEVRQLRLRDPDRHMGRFTSSWEGTLVPFSWASTASRTFERHHKNFSQLSATGVAHRSS
jgi:hypothetical protein